jgi:XTP/dITP diphosphohydrolase
MTRNLIIATRNAHKVVEIQAILGAGFRCLTLDRLTGFPDVVEDETTFVGNAVKKATELRSWLIKNQRQSKAELEISHVLADDSGLEVDALNGAPGVHSARFAALEGDLLKNSSSAENNTKLLRMLAEVPQHQRTARFRCVIAIASTDPKQPLIETFEGACEGRIHIKPGGAGGFGYDPLFIPLGHDKSFAELGEAVKNGLSHRSKALQAVKMRFAVQ